LSRSLCPAGHGDEKCTWLSHAAGLHDRRALLSAADRVAPLPDWACRSLSNAKNDASLSGAFMALLRGRVCLPTPFTDRRTWNAPSAGSPTLGRTSATWVSAMTDDGISAEAPRSTPTQGRYVQLCQAANQYLGLNSVVE
jgi:hypothetical protein